MDIQVVTSCSGFLEHNLPSAVPAHVWFEQSFSIPSSSLHFLDLMDINFQKNMFITQN
jgi:hypothetical protein